MTTIDFFKLVVRRWYVFAIAFAAAGFMVIQLASAPRTYIAQGQIVFEVPPAAAGQIDYMDYEPTLIAFTVAMDRQYNDYFPSIVLSSPNASLYGNGVRDGIAVEASTVGNQWEEGIDRPVLVIDTAADTPEAALSGVYQAADRIGTIATDFQRQTGSPSSGFITSTLDHSGITLSSYGRTLSGTAKGAAVALIVALVLAAFVALGLDRNFRRSNGD